MDKVRVGILRGGNNENYETSLREGAKMIAYITETLPNKAKAVDVFVDKSGVWHVNGIPVLPMDLIYKVDVLWDTTMPALSQVLVGHISLFKIPHFVSAMTSSKALLKEHMQSIGVKMPMHLILPAYQDDIDGPMANYSLKKARDVHAKFGAPWLVKSFTSDPSVGIHVAKTFPELVDSISDLAKHGKSILVEELIPGKIGGLHTVAQFRGEPLYHMLPYEIRYHGIEPAGNFTDEENKKLYEFGDKIYKHLGVENYLHLNFVIHPRGVIYITDVAVMPDFTNDSALVQSIKTVGGTSREVFDHLLELTQK